MAIEKSNIMVDIETLGVKPGCMILSIGAVDFDENGVGQNMFYEFIDLDSAHDWGLTIEPRTALWWMEQNEEARKVLCKSVKKPLEQVIANFVAAYKWRGKQVWCNGASFDFPIIEANFSAVGHKAPWAFWDLRDFRTLKNLVPKDVFESLKVEATVAHDALADAVAQAETTVKLLAYLKGGAAPTAAAAAKGRKRAA